MEQVTQADRDAAANGYFAWVGSNHVMPDKMRAGSVDDHSIVQAFARHRIAHSPSADPALRDALDDLRGKAQFLVDRIDNLDWCDFDDLVRDWNGHVDPPLYRLKEALAALVPPLEGDR